MNASEIQALMSGMKMTLATKVTEIKAVSFKEKYGDLATKLHGYSKRVLQLEGVVSPDNVPEPSTADLVLARAIASDVKGNGWDGSGQGIMKMFSIILGKNLWSKEVGMKTNLHLPKGTLVKTNKGDIGIISHGGNVFKLSSNGDLSKDSYFEVSNLNLELPTYEESVTFLGSVLDNPKSLRTMASRFEVSSVQDFENLLSVANNGLDMQLKDQLDYKTYMADINPDLTTGFGLSA